MIKLEQIAEQAKEKAIGDAWTNAYFMFIIWDKKQIKEDVTPKMHYKFAEYSTKLEITIEFFDGKISYNAVYFADTMEEGATYALNYTQKYNEVFPLYFNDIKQNGRDENGQHKAQDEINKAIYNKSMNAHLDKLNAKTFGEWWKK